MPLTFLTTGDSEHEHGSLSTPAHLRRRSLGPSQKLQDFGLPPPSCPIGLCQSSNPTDAELVHFASVQKKPPVSNSKERRQQALKQQQDHRQARCESACEQD